MYIFLSLQGLLYVYFSKPRGCYIYMYVSSFLSIGAVVCIMLVWTLGVWGELACHKRSLTHRPSSQGWASSVLLLCVCVSLFG